MIDPLERVSVRIKLALMFVSLCLLAYGLGGSLVSRWTETALGDEILARLGAQCRTYAMRLDTSLELLERRLEDFASDGYARDQAARLQSATRLGDQPQTEHIRTVLRRHLERNKLPLVEAYLNLAVTDAEGALLTTVHADGPHRIEPPDHPANVAFAGNPLGEHEPDTDTRPHLLLTKPLHALNGEQTIGHMHALVDAESWIRMSIDPAGDDAQDLSVTMLLHDGAGRSLEVIPHEGRVSGILADAAPHRPADTPTIAPVRGTYARSFPLSESGWWVEVTLSAERALLPVSGLKSRMLGVGIVLSIVSTLLLYFPMRFLVRPLIELTRAAEQLREGQLETRVTVESRDELGALGRSFNSMAGAIQERTRRLEHTAADLRQRQSELRAERDRVEAVISSMHDGLIVLDGRGEVVLSNVAAQPLLGLIEQGNPAMSHHVCIDEEAPIKLRTPPRPHSDDDCFACLMDSQGPPRSCSVDVGVRTFEIHTTPLPLDDMGRRGRVLIAREVTDRVKLDERQIHNERLAVLGEVAAVVAHEINNPLASISMFNQMLAKELPETSPLRENTDVISRNIDSAKRAIRELLDYATATTPEVGRLNLHDVLEDVVRFLRPLSERAGVGVRLVREAEHADITGDEIQLRQVFVNLTMNAIQAVAGHTPTSPDAERMVIIVTLNQEDHLVVNVIDTGPGIDADRARRIFRPFFTTKPRGEGTGLGLPTARRIAEMHGGSLEMVESSGAGTTFRVRLRSRTLMSQASRGSDA